MPRSVVVFHPSDEPYGADRVLVGYLQHLVGRNAEVRVLIPDDVAWASPYVSTELARVGAVAIHAPLPVARRRLLRPAGWPTLLAAAVRGLPAAHRASRGADLVYVNTSAMLPVVPAVIGRPILFHLHECWSATDGHLLAPLLNGVDAIVAVSGASARALPRRWRDRVVVIHNGLPDLPAPTANDKALARSTLGVPSDALLLVCASRWNSWKGHTTLLRAWEAAQLDNAVLAVLGGPPPAGTAVDVPALVRSMSNPKQVRIAGETNDVQLWLSACDAVVVPSTAPDPLPTVVLEAARSTRPSIASRAGGTPEMLIDGETGWLVPPGDVAAWAAALRNIRTEEARARGVAARRAFESEFTQTRAHQRLDSVIGQLETRRRVGHRRAGRIGV